MLDALVPAARRRLSLTPLIDIVFILLLFFMVATSFSQHTDVSIALAGSGTGNAAAERPLVVVTVHVDGTASVNGTRVALDHLTDTIGAAAPVRGEAVVLLRTDAGVAMQDLLSAVSAARRAAVHAVALMD
jgi:biopolymer transport protein ExbD